LAPSLEAIWQQDFLDLNVELSAKDYLKFILIFRGGKMADTVILRKKAIAQYMYMMGSVRFRLQYNTSLT